MEGGGAAREAPIITRDGRSDWRGRRAGREVRPRTDLGDPVIVPAIVATDGRMAEGAEAVHKEMCKFPRGQPVYPNPRTLPMAEID